MAGRTNPVVGWEQVPALEEAEATAGLVRILPTEAGAPAGYLAGALLGSTHAAVDV